MNRNDSVVTATATAVFAPIIKALVGCEEYVFGITRNGWVSINQEQEMFLSRFYSHRHELTAFAPDELKAWARQTAEELNQILGEHSYNIRLDPWPANERTFGVVAIMDALARWVVPGKRCDISCNGQSYPGVKLMNNVYQFSSQAYSHPLLAIQAQGQYEVWMTIADEPLSGLDLVVRIQDIRDAGLRCEAQSIQGFFPMIDLNQEVNIEWLKGIYASGKDGKPVIIDQALQETKFRMNEYGAHAQSAVAVCGSRGITPSVIIDRPFYLWILKDMGSNGPKLNKVPVFAGYLDTDCWADPGNIE